MRCAQTGCAPIGYAPFDVEDIYCQQVKIEPISPLQLAYPTNEAKIKEKKPTFLYIPPGPIAQSNKLKYTVTLVKMNKNQTRFDALQRNRPLLRKTGHSLTSLMFPLDLAELEVGQKYAWQVSVYIGDVWLGTSEVWEFEVMEEKEKKDLPKMIFYQPKQKIGLETYSHKFNDTLALTVEENYIKDENKQWKITAKDISTGTVTDISDGFTETVNQGKHNLNTVFASNYLLKKGKTYLITVTNSANQKNQFALNLFKEIHKI